MHSHVTAWNAEQSQQLMPYAEQVTALVLSFSLQGSLTIPVLLPVMLSQCLPGPCGTSHPTFLPSAPHPQSTSGGAAFWGAAACQRALAEMYLRLAELARLPPLDEPLEPEVHVQVGVAPGLQGTAVSSGRDF